MSVIVEAPTVLTSQSKFMLRNPATRVGLRCGLGAGRVCGRTSERGSAQDSQVGALLHGCLCPSKA